MKYKFIKHPSKYTTLMITFGAGGRVEYKTKYKPGISHLHEHMIFKGGENCNFRQITESIANAGGNTNAWTSNDLVSYLIQIPEENIEVAFKNLSEMTLRSIFPQKELDKEKEVVCQEVRMYNDMIEELMDASLKKRAFSNSLENPLIGTEESVRAITRQDLLDFKQQFCTKDHMLISLAAPTDYGNLVEKYFGTPDDIWIKLPRPEAVLYGSGSSDRVIKDGQIQNSINISFGSNKLIDSVSDRRHVHSVFNTLFGSGMASRLFMSVREELGLVYSIGSSLDYNFDGTLYQIHTQTDPENSDNVISEINRQIDIICNEEPKEEELLRAKNKIRTKAYSRQDTSIGSLTETLSAECYGFKMGDKYLEDIDSVTASDVKDLVNLIFSGNKYITIGSGK